MVKIRQTEEIREYILNSVEAHPQHIARMTSERFGISRPAVSKHLRSLIEGGFLEASGSTSARRYSLREILDESWRFKVDEIEEDRVWRENVRPHLKELPENIFDICYYGFTEMLNNVIDHSESEEALVHLSRTATNLTINVIDAGVGIFKKIQAEFDLHDPRHALLELSKGKLTTDEARHTGEGIFYTSRMFDKFTIVSDTLCFIRENDEDDWLIETSEGESLQGTIIRLEIKTKTQRTSLEVFEKFAAGEEDLDFSRTHVPLQLLLYEGEELISRSQAKRLLIRLDGFREVLLDFKGIKRIGQAFADEIFRVYKNTHPHVEIVDVGATEHVQQMINRARRR